MANNNNENQKRIEAIEKELWLMEFKDHWTAADHAKDTALRIELAQLRG